MERAILNRSVWICEANNPLKSLDAHNTGVIASYFHSPRSVTFPHFNRSRRWIDDLPGKMRGVPNDEKG